MGWAPLPWEEEQPEELRLPFDLGNEHAIEGITVMER